MENNEQIKFPTTKEIVANLSEADSQKIAEQGRRCPEMVAYGEKLTKEKSKLLNAPNMFEVLTEEVHKQVQGEDLPIKAILLHAGGMWVANAKKTSYNLLVNANSGAGKDHTTDNTLKIIPPCFLQKKSAISPKAFVYWHNHKAEPEWTWDGKVCYLQDTSNDIINSETFKVFCSEGSSVTVVIDHKAVEMDIVGKPILILTTATVELENELLRRMTCINLDESVNQTKAIMEKQSKEAMTLEKEQYPAEKIWTDIMLLKRVNVKVPFAEKLMGVFPSDSIIARTHYRRMIDLIKASAAWHQSKRVWAAENTIEATWADYDMVRDVVMAITTNKQLIQLSKKQKEIIAAASELIKKQEHWKVSEFAETYPQILALSKLYKYLPRLVELGFLLKKTEHVEGTVKDVGFYRLSDQAIFNIPTSGELISPYLEPSKGCSNMKSPISPNTEKRPYAEPPTFIKGTLVADGDFGENREIDINKDKIGGIRGNWKEMVNEVQNEELSLFYSLPVILLPCCRCDLKPTSDEVRLYNQKPICSICFPEEAKAVIEWIKK